MPFCWQLVATTAITAVAVYTNMSIRVSANMIVLANFLARQFTVGLVVVGDVGPQLQSQLLPQTEAEAVAETCCSLNATKKNKKKTVSCCNRLLLIVVQQLKAFLDDD